MKVMLKVYIFFGPPSSGKSYLGKRYAKLKDFTFYEADDDYLPEYRERIKISDDEKQRVYDEFYTLMISKIKDLLHLNKSVVVASAMGKNTNRMRFVEAFGDAVIFVLVKSEIETLIVNAIKREFPEIDWRVLPTKSVELLREHLINKVQKFEEPDFPYATIQNDYTEKTIIRLSKIP